MTDSGIIRSSGQRKVRYAVIGLGHIAQVAILPAFRNARDNAELAALVSGDTTKLKKLKRRYRVPKVLGYDRLDDLLQSGAIDAVYIALPNDMHHEFALRAIHAGVHVICEKPLAVTVRQCEEMIAAAERAGVLLMTAYRLHYEQATLRAIEIAQTGELGDLRFFSSTFAMKVEDDDNIRLSAERGGGPLFDLGIYCINAARSVFRAEPIEVAAMDAASDDPRFKEVPEMTSAVMRFPDERLATFTCSFGSADVSTYQIVGTRGQLRVEPGYDYSKGLAHQLTIDGRLTKRRYPKRDQFAPELIDFSRAILERRQPEPNGREGLADVRVIQALMRSAASGKVVRLDQGPEVEHPDISQATYRPPIDKPDEIKVESPRG